MDPSRPFCYCYREGATRAPATNRRMKLTTKREYLVGLGLAKSRGRFSADARKAIHDAINKGVRFDEAEKAEKTVTVKTTDDKGRRVVLTKRVNDVPEVPDPRTDRPRGMYVFKNPDGSTFERGVATACFRCSYSFQWCYCPDGPVLLAHPHRPGLTELATMHRKPKLVTTTKQVPEKQPTRGTGGTRRGGTRGGTRRRRAA